MEQFIIVFGNDYTKSNGNLSHTWRTANSYLLLYENLGPLSFPNKIGSPSRKYYDYDITFAKRNWNEKITELKDKEKERINSTLFDDDLNNF